METASQLPFAPSSANSQWLGIECYNHHWAVALHHVQSIFQAALSAQSGMSRILDIEIHAGMPIFIESFESCFDLPTELTPHSPESEDRRWILVLPQNTSSPRGCRVQQVLGPFWAVPVNGHVPYDNRSWRIIQPANPLNQNAQGV